MHPLLARGRFGLYLAGWIPLAGLLAFFLARGGTLGWIEAAALAVPLSVVYAFVCLSAWYLCRMLPPTRATLPRLAITFLAAASLSSALWVMAARLLGAALSMRIQQQESWLLAGMGVMLYLLSVVFHYLMAEVEASQAARQRETQALMLARDAELRALRAQVNPHFLFNSLNSISALTGSDRARAREMCVLLADFLRQSLSIGERRLIPLGDELALARNYLAIEKVRFGARMCVEEDIDPQCLDVHVPPLTLQPLVENAVRHGIAQMVEPGLVRVEAHCAGTSLRVTVENSFDPEAPRARSGGLGQRNVRQRLAALYGDAARFDAQVRDGRYRVEIRIPLKEDQA